MRRFFLLVALVLLLLGAPIGLRYLNYYQLGGADYEAPPTYSVSELPRVPTPASSSFVDDPDVGKGFVLLDLAHNNDFNLDELDYLDSRLAARGFELLPYRGGDLTSALRPAAAFIVAAPLESFSQDEIRTVADFVDRGGRLLLIGDPTRFTVETVESQFSLSFRINSDDIPLNTLANEFGLSFNGDYLYNTVESEANYQNIILDRDSFAEEELTEELETLVFYGSHSLQVGPGGLTLLEAGGDTWSSATQRAGGLALAALNEDERVLALGDVDFLSAPYYTVYDNARFVAHIADFLVEAGRDLVLADFPYFFGNPVDLIYTGDPALGPDAFDEIISLQHAFRRAGQSLSLADAGRSDHDALYLGLYNQAGEVEEMLEAAGVELVIDPPLSPADSNGRSEEEDGNGDEETNNGDEVRQIQSDLGNVQMSGTALLLLQEEANRRQVMVLAASSEGLENTVGRLLSAIPPDAEDVLADCLLQEHLALCPTGVSDEPVEAELLTSGVPEDLPSGANADDVGGGVDGEYVEAIDATLQGTIGIGDTRDGTLAEEEAHGWTFSETPAIVDIVVESGEELDAVLELYDAGDELVDSVDGSFTGEAERLESVELSDGSYTIVVRDFFADGGSYSLTVAEAGEGEEDGENGEAGGDSSIFIFADDDGVPAASGFTSADALADLLSADYNVTVWRTTEDGALQEDTLSDQDLVIWSSGDYRTENADSDEDTLAVLNYFFSGGRLLVFGATPPFLETEDVQVAPLSDLQVVSDNPDLVDGFTDGETISLDQVYTASVIDETDLSDQEGAYIVFLRGPASDAAGNAAAVAIEESNFFLQTAPFVSLPADARQQLLTNLIAWLDV